MTVHDAPTMAELIEAVREFLENDVMAATQGRVNFHTRIAVNVLKIVERELVASSLQDEHHAQRLAALGFESDAALAAAIRSGSLDDKFDELVAAVQLSVADKLAVANPKYFAE